jgi:hypothetical protein
MALDAMDVVMENSLPEPEPQPDVIIEYVEEFATTHYDGEL